MRKGLIIRPFSRRGNRGTQRLNNFPSVIQMASRTERERECCSGRSEMKNVLLSFHLSEGSLMTDTEGSNLKTSGNISHLHLIV